MFLAWACGDPLSLKARLSGLNKSLFVSQPKINSCKNCSLLYLLRKSQAPIISRINNHCLLGLRKMVQRHLANRQFADVQCMFKEMCRPMRSE